MKTNDGLEETIVEQKNDYSLINRYADLTIERQRSLLANDVVVRLRRVIVAISALILTVGVSIFLYFYGMSLMEKAKRAEPAQIPQVLTEIQETMPEKSTDGKDKVIDTKFTVFFTYNAADYSIVTGWNFTPVETKKPYNQYCYHSKATLGVADLTTYLARKDNDLPIIWEANVSTELRRLAKQHCKFQ